MCKEGGSLVEEFEEKVESDGMKGMVLRSFGILAVEDEIALKTSSRALDEKITMVHNVM